MTDKLRVSAYIAQSVDGFIARPDGDVTWLSELEPLSEEDDGGFGDFMATIDAVVMGRNSFEKVLTLDWWGYGDTPVIVLSRSLTEVPERLRESVRIDRAAPQALVEQLAQAGYRRIYLDGGRVIQSFLREGLVDDMIVTTVPILLGGGIPLFGHLGVDIRLRLLDTRQWGRGSVQASYQVLR